MQALVFDSVTPPPWQHSAGAHECNIYKKNRKIEHAVVPPRRRHRRVHIIITTGRTSIN